MERIHSIVLGIADPLASDHLRRRIDEHPRFQLSAVAANAVQTLALVEAHQPAVALMADASPGLRGREVLGDIAKASPNTLVIITTPGDPTALVGEPAVAEALPEHDPAAAVAALTSLAIFLDDPAAIDMPERRRGSDRRLMQDWTKVFAERRVTIRRAGELISES